MSSESYKIGAEFETVFARKTGAKLTPGSGATWHTKMDATTGSIVWSLKRTKRESFSVNKSLFDELDRATNNVNSAYDSVPALCVSAGDLDELVVIKLDDFMALLSSEKLPSFQADRKDEKYRNSRVPELLREKDA